MKIALEGIKGIAAGNAIKDAARQTEVKKLNRAFNIWII
jgi:hypothetical protein